MMHRFIVVACAGLVGAAVCFNWLTPEADPPDSSRSDSPEQAKEFVETQPDSAFSDSNVFSPDATLWLDGTTDTVVESSGMTNEPATGTGKCASVAGGVAVSNELECMDSERWQELQAAFGQQIDFSSMSAEQIAEIKELYMRERFGLVFRNEKWIPTVAGGTSLVYITTGSLPRGRVGEEYEVQFEATSGQAPYTWSVVGGQLPDGFTFDVSSGRLVGVPASLSTENFFLQVTDSKGARDVAEYVINFEPEQSLGILTESLPAAICGESYAFQLQATGGVPPYAWSAQGEVDRIGDLVLDPQTGKLYGEIVPEAPCIDVPLVIWLSDAQVTVSRELVLHCREGLSIVSVPETSYRESEPFEFVLEASGGAEPYTWMFSGTPPPGIEFYATGLCNGCPTEAGTYHVAAWVQDAEGLSDAVEFELNILPVPETSVGDFAALLSRNSVALQWDMPSSDNPVTARIVRNSMAVPAKPSDGKTVYLGAESSCLDADIGAGSYYYAAFLEQNGTLVTSAPPPSIGVTLPPDVDSFADSVVSSAPLHANAFGSDRLPDVVLGGPRGGGLSRGSTDVLSLGADVQDDAGASAPYGGVITLEFTDNLVWDGPGPDFTVFENVIYISDSSGVLDPEKRFMEPAVVSVSADGVNWHQFQTDFSPRYDPDTGELNLRHPYCYNSGFAGVNPVMTDDCDPDPTDPTMSGGDAFDISDVGLEYVRFVRIQSTGSCWLLDRDGDLIYHTEQFSATSRSSRTSGFDLDAVTAIWMKKVTSE